MKIGPRSMKIWCTKQFRLIMGYEQYPDRLNEVPRGCIKTSSIPEPPKPERGKGWFMEERAGCNVYSPVVEEVDDGPVACIIDTRPIVECDYDGCESEATLWDMMDNKVCEDCMEREVSDGASTYDEFTSITG